MSSVAEAFARCNSQNSKTLVCFVVGGDPSIQELTNILQALQEGGADIIEIGIPFSDPIADGPTIQAASQRALDRGTNPVQIMEVIRKAQLKVPIVLMGYTNTALRMGLKEFAKRCVDSGVSGVILSDLIPEEAEDWITIARKVDLDTIFLVAPTSTETRIQLACKSSSGFVYCVSRTGVTGAQATLPDELQTTVQKIRTITSMPICVGFGISSQQQVKAVCQIADGVVVGSYLVETIYNQTHPEARLQKLKEVVADLKMGTHIP